VPRARAISRASSRMSKKLPLSDFPTVRSKLELHEFAISEGQDVPPSNLIDPDVWHGMRPQGRRRLRRASAQFAVGAWAWAALRRGQARRLLLRWTRREHRPIARATWPSFPESAWRLQGWCWPRNSPAETFCGKCKTPCGDGVSAVSGGPEVAENRAIFARPCRPRARDGLIGGSTEVKLGTG
jgi:hypothetical protein